MKIISKSIIGLLSLSCILTFSAEETEAGIFSSIKSKIKSHRDAKHAINDHAYDLYVELDVMKPLKRKARIRKELKKIKYQMKRTWDTNELRKLKIRANVLDQFVPERKLPMRKKGADTYKGLRQSMNRLQSKLQDKIYLMEAVEEVEAIKKAAEAEAAAEKANGSEKDSADAVNSDDKTEDTADLRK
jgi:hypothetical protein